MSAKRTISVFIYGRCRNKILLCFDHIGFGSIVGYISRYTRNVTNRRQVALLDHSNSVIRGLVTTIWFCVNGLPSVSSSVSHVLGVRRSHRIYEDSHRAAVPHDLK